MSKLNALKCLFGVHAWAKWVGHRNAAGALASQTRNCKRCPAQQVRPWRGRSRDRGPIPAQPPVVPGN